MTSAVPDSHLWRRVATLEKQAASLEGLIRRMSLTRSVTPLTGRIWLFTLTSNFNAGTNTASADLYDLDETDTGVDITIEDPLANWASLSIVSGNKGVCEEQIDLKGARHYIVVEWKCP